MIFINNYGKFDRAIHNDIVLKRIQVILLLFTLLAINGYSGWVLTVRESHSDSDAATTMVIYFQENKIKLVESDLTTIFDLNQQIITFLKPQIQLYWRGTLEDYRIEVNETLGLMINIEVEKLPVDQQEEARKMFETMMRIMESPDTSSSIDIYVRETGENENILGYETQKYQVFLNGVIIEDLWIPQELDVSNDLDLEKYLSLICQLSTGFEYDIYYQTTAEYSQLIKDKYILRSKEYRIGYQTVCEVIEIREESLNESNFLPPPDYKSVTLSELGIINTGDEE